MYLHHFGLKEMPFGMTPDTSFIFSTTAFQEALNTLLIGLKSGEGFIKIIAEVGSGKTLLCRRFLATLGDNYVVAYLPNPMLDPRTLLLAIAEELKLVPTGEDLQFQLLKALNQHLLEMAAAGKSVLVCLDEAQSMPLESLEALRLLSNLETEKRKLMQVVMFGQPELDTKLADPAVRQLRQRIGFHYHMGGLRQVEVRHYLAHRLRIAGHLSGDLFTAAALRSLSCFSDGVPRLLNVLAHKSLLATFGEGKTRVGRTHVLLAARDTEDARHMSVLRRWAW